MMKPFLVTSALVTATVALGALPVRSQPLTAPLTVHDLSPALDQEMAVSKQQNNRPDSRVGQALDRLNLQYSIEDSGAYRITLNYTQERRRQTGIILSNTSTVGTLEVRTIASLAYVHNGPLPPDLARRLLMENGNRTLGAWRTLDLDGGQTAVLYTAHVDANANPEGLQSALRVVLGSADRLEQELTRQDQF